MFRTCDTCEMAATCRSVEHCAGPSGFPALDEPIDPRGGRPYPPGAFDGHGGEFAALAVFLAGPRDREAVKALHHALGINPA